MNSIELFLQNLDLILFVITVLLTISYFSLHFYRLPPATRANSSLRDAWFVAINNQQGSEILGVQTIRNSLMACTMTATTATLAFMGGMTLSVNLQLLGKDSLETTLLQFFNAFAVLLLLGTAFITSMLAARNYHHAGFVAGMPVGSPERQQWQQRGQKALNSAGIFYSQSLRLMFWVIPMSMFYVDSVLGAFSAIALFSLLTFLFDKEHF